MKFKALVLAVLSVLMMALPMVPGGVRTASAQSSFDDQRVADLSEIVSAYEAYGQVHGTYKIPGAGYYGRGYIQFNLGGTPGHPFSMADALVAEGLLDGNDVPSEPSSGQGYVTYLCRDRIGLFSIDDDLTTDPDDLAWWNSNCRSEPFNWGMTYMQLSDPFTYQGSPASDSPVSDVVTALEQYQDDHGTFVVRHAGGNGQGWGSFSRDNVHNYKDSIQNALIVGGYLDAQNQPEDPDSLSTYQSGMYVSWCSGRLAVFARATETAAAPSAADAAFWSDNNCATWMFGGSYDLDYFELGVKLDYDQIRAESAAEIVEALNLAASELNTAFLDDMGYQRLGTGWYSVQDHNRYRTSVANGLARAGYLDPYDMPAEDPWIAIDYRNGHITFDCNGRRAVFTRAFGTIEPTPEDEAWWAANNCRRPQVPDHTYFVLTNELPMDQIRAEAVATIVDVFEDYGRDNFTYVVPGTASQGSGNGSFRGQGGSDHPLSIANGLINDGYLPEETVIREPLSRDGLDDNGLVVYQCQDRMAAFSLADTIAPSVEDSTWWADNNCPTNGLDTGRTYFELSAPLPFDEARQTAITTVLTAMGDYARDHGTFLIDGAGLDGNSNGWFTGTGASYAPNLADALVAAGYLDADSIPEDPRRDIDPTNGLRVEHCNDRVAVFALSNGAEPTTTDTAWWADNNCDTTVLATHSYFQLSAPATNLYVPPTYDEPRQQAVAQAVAALEAYGAVNATYTVNAGVNGDGTGFYHQSGATTDSIVDVLVAEGHLVGDVLVDPFYVDPVADAGSDFLVYPCGNRVGVFAQTNTLTPFSDDSAWWADNNCDTTPLATHGYFQLAVPLDVLDEPYVVVYSASATSGYKTATIRVQPQGDPIAIAYATATITGSVATPSPNSSLDGCPDGSICGSSNAVPAAAPTIVGCGDEAFCEIDQTTGTAHFLMLTEQGWTAPTVLAQFQVPQEEEVDVEVLVATVQDLIDDLWDDLKEALGFGPDRTPSGAIIGFGGYVGIDALPNPNPERCAVDWNTANYPEEGLDLPENFELRTFNGGLVWVWDDVDNSRQCFNWRTVARDKNGDDIGGTLVLGVQSLLAAPVTGRQLNDRTATLCIGAEAMSWVDQQAGITYWSPSHPLYKGDLTPREHCKPAPRNWGDMNCDGVTDARDFAHRWKLKAGLVEPCASEFEADLNWDDALDKFDGVLFLACTSRIPFGDIDLNDCDRINNEPLPAGGTPDVSRDGSTIEVVVAETSNGQDPVVTVTIDGELFSSTTPDGPGSIIVDLPPETTGEVCIEIVEQGPGASPFSSQECFDFFTVVAPECASRAMEVAITNNSDARRDYEVTFTWLANNQEFVRTLSVDPGVSDTLEYVGVARGAYDVSVAANGVEIAASQTIHTAECVQLSSDCTGAVSAELFNIGTEPAVFELQLEMDDSIVETLTSGSIAPQSTGTLSGATAVVGFYDATVLRNSQIVHEELFHVGEGCNVNDVCANPLTSYVHICETAANLFVSVEAAARFHTATGNTEEAIIALGGLDHERSGVSVQIDSLMKQGPRDDLNVLALLAVTQDELNDLVADEQAALRARIALVAGVEPDSSDLSNRGLNLEIGLPDNQGYTVIRNQHNIAILAWEPDDLRTSDLSGATERFRRTTDTDQTSQKYQELWEEMSDTASPDATSAAAFVLFRTGDADLAESVRGLNTGYDPSCNPSCSDPAASGAGLDGLHAWLDWIGFLPVLGESADFVNGVIYYVQEDDTNAAISWAATIPAIGSVGTGSRVARSLPADLVDDVVGSTRSVDNAGNWIYRVGDDAIVEGIEGTSLRSGSILVSGERAGTVGHPLLGRLSNAAIADNALRYRVAEAARYLPTAQQDELITVINNATPEIAERIATNASLDAVATATILGAQQRGVPRLAETMLGNPQFSDALVTSNGHLGQTAQRSFRRLDEVLDTATDTEIDEFTNNLLGALARNYDNPELTLEEMTALYRATSPNPTLTETELRANYNAGRRYNPNPNVPDNWPKLHGLSCRSFSADTLVLLADGTHRPISQIAVGDIVLATDPEKGETGPRKVTAVWPHQDTLVNLRVGSGFVTTTEDHHFWNHTDQQWQETQNIDIGDQLLTPDGTTIAVEGLDWTTRHTADAYDLTIADVHTYYVNAGDNDVLVHNTDTCTGAQLKAVWESAPDSLTGSFVRSWDEWAEDGWRYDPDSGTWDASNVDSTRFNSDGTVHIYNTVRSDGTYFFPAEAPETPQPFTPIEGPLSAQSDGRYVYVVRDDADRTLVIARESEAGHWDLALGQDVRAAGEIKVDQSGFSVTNESGHFFPSGPAQQIEAIDAFSRLNDIDPNLNFIPAMYDDQPYA